MRNNPLSPLAPIAATAVAALLFVYISGELRLGEGLDQQLIDMVAAQVEKSRMLWGAAALCLSVALVWNAAISIFILFSTLEDESILIRAAFSFVLLAVVFLGLSYLESNDPSGPFATQLISGIKEHARVNVVRLTCHGNRLAVETVCLVLASVACLSLPRRAHTITDLSRTIRMWQLSLYSASVLLAIGLFEVWALFRWGASVAGKDAIEPITAVADGLALASGLIFSLFLSVIYVPVAVLHDRWLSQHIAEQADRDPLFEVDKWLARNGLKSSPITVGTALAAPIISFLFTTIVKELSKTAT